MRPFLFWFRAMLFIPAALLTKEKDTAYTPYLDPPKGVPPPPAYEIAPLPGEGYAYNVQRLFSMFPTGAAGLALFILRISVSLSLLVDGTERWALVTSWWALLLILLPAMLLILGFLTPYACAVSCLVQAGVVLLAGGHDQFHLILAILNSGAVALLGPGAYSIDAHFFGRRLVTVPPGK